MTTIELSVPTVHCRSCKLNIEEALEEVDGVSAGEVDLDRKAVTVTYDPAGATVAEVARGWGFADPGRFADYYRARYGVSPSRTLSG